MLSNQNRPHYLNHGPLDSMRGGETMAPNGRVLERKPSKLEQMRTDYQKKLMKEKEEKMVLMYEENQRKAMERIARNDGPSGHGGKSVREFFNERRRLEASGAPVPPIDNHYRLAKGYNSPGGWSSRTGSGHSTKGQKVSAGRDRSNPLAPIRRPMDTQEVSNNNARSGIPQRQQQQQQPVSNGYHGYGDGDNPFNDKPRLVKHKPLPSPSNQQIHDDPPAPHENGVNSFRQTQLKYSPQHTAKPSPHAGARQLQYQRQNHQQHQPQPPSMPQARPVRQTKPPTHPQNKPPSNFQPKPPPTNGHASSRSPVNKGQGQQKLTDFQKWQLEQNKARENRLKKFNAGHHSPRHNGGFGDYEENGVEYEEEEDEEENEEDEDKEEEDFDEDAARQEKELLEKIARQQAELNRVKQQRHQLEEEEKRDRERMKKKEAMERARQKQMEEEERREEERRRKEEEEEMRMDKQREEKRRKEMEKQRKEDEKRRKEDERLMAKRQKEEEKRMREEEKRRKEEEKRMAKQQAKLSARKAYDDEDEYGYEDEPNAYPRSHQSSPRKGNVTDRSVDIDERPAVANADANYYAQMAKASEAKGSVGSLSSCRNCGRKFAVDRLKKHQDACAKANKPRKEFNTAKHRVEGTEMAQYYGKAKRPDPVKKNNWRSKHEEFINNLRYAKKVSQVEKEGGDVRAIAPPPTTENPDLVPCPWCNRTFNSTAAERHIPRCKDLKTRPPPMKTKRR